MININLKKNFKFEKISLINFTNLTAEENEMIRNWRNEESIRNWMFSDHIITKEEHMQFLNRLKSDNKNFSWLIRNNDSYLGVLNFNQVNFKHRNAYFGFYVNPNIKLPGIAVLIDRIAIKLAFEVTGLHTIKLEALGGNKVIKLHRKLGFKEEGRLKEFILKEDKWQDVIIMGMTNKKS